MELREYISIIRKRVSLIILITFLSTLISFVISFFILPDVYESGTTLYVGKQVDVQSQLMYQDIMMGQTLVKDYREIAKSKTVTQKVKVELDKLQSDNQNLKKALLLDDQAFTSKIAVNLKNDTRIIEIKVSDQDPEVTAIIANQVAEAFKEKALELLKIENVQILDKAETPTVPVKPNKKMNIAVSFMAGLMAALGLVFLIEYLDNSIKTPDDVTKHTGLTVIGVIPKFELIEEEK